MAFASVAFKFAAKKVKNLAEGWAYFNSHEVVVGVTEESNSGHGEMDCASLLYLHEAGVPSRNIPARPVIKPALAQKDVNKEMKRHIRKAMVNAMVLGNVQGAEEEMNKAGMVGRDACKKWITDGDNLAPNAPSTIAKKGSAIPLIDTGQLLESISYEVRRK